MALAEPVDLDAPLVAVAWAWMFSRAWGVVSLPWELWLTLGVAVWIVYAIDRLLDVRRSKQGTLLDKRHYFHERYRTFYVVGIALGAGWVIYSTLWALSQNVLFYGAFVLFLTVGYFVVAMTRTGAGHTGITQSVVAGLTFAYGTAAGVHAYSPVFNFSQMLVSWEVILFAGLCAINMTAIDFWELKGEDEEDASALLGTATLIVGGAAMFLSLKGDDFNKPFFYSILVGAAGLPYSQPQPSSIRKGLPPPLGRSCHSFARLHLLGLDFL